MAESERAQREWEKRQAGHALAHDTRIPGWLSSQKLTAGQAARLLQLVTTKPDTAMQDLDPLSPMFGHFFFVPDASIPGGPDVIR